MEKYNFNEHPIIKVIGIGIYSGEKEITISIIKANRE